MAAGDHDEEKGDATAPTGGKGSAEDNRTAATPGDAAPEPQFTFEVLRLVREAQQQHGLRHGDYQRYRQYCSRRLRRVRKALHFPQGAKNRVTPKKIAGELLKDARVLYLPLIDAERAWAYAMQLKSESNTEPRKRFHMLSRLRKAVQHSEVMGAVCDAGRYDARTKLEVQAYMAWMKGLLDLEREDWKAAMENFTNAKTIYGRLGDAVHESVRDVYVARCEEIEPNVRYCAYNIGDESAVADLLQMRLKVSREDPLTSRLDELIEKTRAQQTTSLSEVTWLGRTVAVRCEAVRALLLSIQHNERQLAGAGAAGLSTPEQRLSLCESLLKELIEAQQALKDDLKDDQAFKARLRGGGTAGGVQAGGEGGKAPDSVYLHSYLAYLRLTTSVERNLLLVESLKGGGLGGGQGGGQEEGKKNRPQDFARLYDVVIQNLMEIPHLPGLEEQTTFCRDIGAQITGYKAFRCFHVAQTYSSVKKWKEAVALYEKTLEYATTALSDYSKSQLDPAKKARAREGLEELMSTVDGLKYSVRASSILDSQDLRDDPSPSTTHKNKPLCERLDEYCEDPALTSKKPSLTQFPPDFQPIPAKPLFFDLALSLVEFPSLADRVEQKTAAGSGIAGFVKGWLFGGGKKK